jgi:hypothetical protein
VFDALLPAFRMVGYRCLKRLAEKAAFTPRLVAILALANLGGPLFARSFSGCAVRPEFNALPSTAIEDFPVMRDEVRSSASSSGTWCGEGFATDVSAAAASVHVSGAFGDDAPALARFYDQGLLLSKPFAGRRPSAIRR